MNDGVFVGFDTSNYTTSVALCGADGRILENIKLPLPVKEGECGLRQSDAVFAHVKNLPDATERLEAALRDKKILAVGCSVRPRDVQGSYMPCFLSGKAAAKALSVGAHAPLYTFSHQSGHIMAALYSSGAPLLERPFAAYHVSGGTTELVTAKYKKGGFDVELIGGTRDLNAGQAIDRAGVMMGLSFPCGRELEALAKENEKKIPKPHVSVDGTYCNLSGLENHAAKIFKETEDKRLVAAFVFDFIARTLLKMTENLYETYGDVPVLFAGGVMSNSIIKEKLSGKFDAYFAAPEFSSDNAAGVALLTRLEYTGK